MTPPHWFEPLADHLGPAYLRYSFTRGTVREIDALWSLLELRTGDRVLDVGCGPGRHVGELATRGVRAVGLDVSWRFLEVARDRYSGATGFVRGDARSLPFVGGFDAAISLCQGAFGLNRRTAGPGGGPEAGPDPDLAVLGQIAGALRPGGRLALTAFSSYFQVRWLEDTDSFDVATGCNHERTTIRDEQGHEMAADLWTTCFTPRELGLAATAVGLDVTGVWSAAPGDYAQRPPDLDHPELLLVARRPGS